MTVERADNKLFDDSGQEKIKAASGQIETSEKHATFVLASPLSPKLDKRQKPHKNTKSSAARKNEPISVQVITSGAAYPTSEMQQINDVIKLDATRSEEKRQ